MVFYRVLPSFTGFYRVLPSFTGFYLVLPGFLVGTALRVQFDRFDRKDGRVHQFALTVRTFYRVLPSFTELYRVVPSFTGFTLISSITGFFSSAGGPPQQPGVAAHKTRKRGGRGVG